MASQFYDDKEGVGTEWCAVTFLFHASIYFFLYAVIKASARVWWFE